jgi:hypothetical protein
MGFSILEEGKYPQGGGPLSGVSVEELLDDYPCLEREDIMEALQYAAAPAQGREAALADS